ncbi:hypothetical protein POM88_006281 [Heracleum sosnowskyi]|uniref:Uncharacterized protein n=1 Tax=Heracleum sosnowskyi TaxID=360622 RepID=A0AAD8J4K2_9APIA|nr:hypothetical protein POM88_006281 [Heracleum sosnowskyi]
MVLACYALSYLTCETCVLLQDQTCKRLVEFTLHKSLSLSGAALGVVGNIVRWGCFKQFKCLIGDCQLLQCLRNKVLCSKFQKLRMEGCQIISNMAAQIRTLKNDIDEPSLICLLCKLLEEDDSDVRMEAAWAIFYTHSKTYPLR